MITGVFPLRAGVIGSAIVAGVELNCVSPACGGYRILNMLGRFR